MKISSIDDQKIRFDNGNSISYQHRKDCSEYNFADFQQIDYFADYVDFDENLQFESVPNAGFRFGSGTNMFFVPCYSEQNGYYTSEIEIWYNCHHKRRKVLHFDALVIDSFDFD